MPTKVVFIASLEHSGSTLLDLILGGHPQLTGLGEIFLLLKPESRRLANWQTEQCSCGQTMDQCFFWRPICLRLLEAQTLSLAEKYRLVLDAFHQTFGDEHLLVDSSKTLQALQVLHAIPDVDLKVLYLIRDVRSWVVSLRDVRKRQSAFSLRDLVRRYGVRAGWYYLQRTAFFFTLRWYYSNRKLQRYVQRLPVPTFQLGYEELSLYPEKMVQQISRFLGVEMTDTMLTLQNSDSHNIIGNRMRLQPEKRARVFYDNRWFYRNDWVLPTFLSPYVMRYNTREVYRNLHNFLWNQ
ncbi:MAG: sulfotransferase [Caldilineae bacterium]|nr:MAG: sulfotransferase [Caldilineae bacterium]